MSDFGDWPPLAKCIVIVGLLTCGLPFICLWLPALMLIRMINSNRCSPEMEQEDNDPWSA